MYAEGSNTDPSSENRPENAQKAVDPDWWKHIFDETYLLTDARSIGNEWITRVETDLMERFLQVARDDPILDLCGGQGRHALELARRGYTNITTLDYSEYLLALGKQSADASVRFVRSDARCLPFGPGGYRAVAIMACSFGYFQDDRENAALLRESHRVLAPGGILLIDIPDAQELLKNMAENIWHQADPDVFVLRTRKPCCGGIAVRELVISMKRGLIRESSYFEKLYTTTLIRILVSSVGFRAVKVYRGLKRLCQEEDMGFMSSRMLVTARKSGRPWHSRKK